MHEHLVKLIRTRSTELIPVHTGENFRAASEKTDSTKKIKCVLFDVYGTLFISASGDISLAQNQHNKNTALEAFKKKYDIDIPVNEIPARFIAEVRKEHIRLKNMQIQYPEVQVEEIWGRILGINDGPDMETCRMIALDYELTVNPVYPMPYVSDVLSYIDKNNIPMGIVSNAQFFTPLLFDAFLGKPPAGLGFEESLCFFSFSHRRAKPDTFLYNLAASALASMNIKPEETLYVGNDMLNDIMPARECEFMTALFAGDNRSLRWREDVEQCKNIHPDWVLSSLKDLIRIF